MELITIFGAFVVVYGGWLTFRDNFKCIKKSVLHHKAKSSLKKRKQQKAKTSCIEIYQGDGVAVRSPLLSKGSALCEG